jgi:hypothetical protein
MNDFALALIWLGAFSMVVLTVYFYMRYRSVTAVDVVRQERNTKYPKDWQKPGIVVIGLGIGIFVSGIIPSIPNIRINELIQIGVMVIFTGASLVIAQQFDKKDSKED